MKSKAIFLLISLFAANFNVLAQTPEMQACELIAKTARGVMELRQTGATQREVEIFFSTVEATSKEKKQVTIANWSKTILPHAYQERLGSSDMEKAALIQAFEWKTQADCLKQK